MKLPVQLIQAVSAVGNCLKANSPKIFVGIGVVSSVLAVVDAVHQTPKAMDILDEHAEKVEKCKEALAMEDSRYTVREYKKEIFTIYVKTFGKLLKCYARPIILEITAVLSFLGATKILSVRNKALASTLAATVDAAMSDRQKVADAIGQEKADEIFNGVSSQKYTEDVLDEQGKSKKLKGVRTLVDPDKVSPYSFVWSEDDPGWDQIFEYNVDRIVEVEKILNRKLFGEKHDDGRWAYKPTDNFHVSLNDIRKFFLDPSKVFTQIGQVAGCDASHPDGHLSLRWKRVSVPCDDNPNFFKDGILITPNLPGSMCPDYVM